MWDKILSDPWQDVFLDPKVARHHPEDYGLDGTTVDFIDGVSHLRFSKLDLSCED